MDKRPLGITILGRGNIIIGLLSLLIFFLPFTFGVILGWVTDMKIYGSTDWFCRLILDRLGDTILYFSSFILFCSGISMLKMKVYSRKFSIVAAIGVILSIFIWIISTNIALVQHNAGLDINFLWVFISLLILAYMIISITYLVDPGVKKLFNDEEVKFPFLIVSFIILVLLFVPLIWSPNR